MSSDTDKKVEVEDDRHSDNNSHTSARSTSETAIGDPTVAVLNGEKTTSVGNILVPDTPDGKTVSLEAESVEQYSERQSDDSEVESAGDSEEDDDNEDDGEEDEDSEPALKYALLGGVTNVILHKDAASALAVSKKHVAIGTHAGIIHILDHTGERVKSYRPHSASVLDLCFDDDGDFIASASIDGLAVIHPLSNSEAYSFDKKRPLRTIALEPGFGKRSSRAFVCGGMAGTLVFHEKGWLGHKETVIHSSEGPIWTARWRGTLIAWANDVGVKIYDTVSQTRITYIDRPADTPRADLFKCTLHWQDDSTLLIAWADMIKVARVRARPRTSSLNGSRSSSPNPGEAKLKVLPPLMAEITAVFAIDEMISGIVPHPADPILNSSVSAPSAFLVLAYTPPDMSFKDEVASDSLTQRRKPAQRPELRIISRSGEELSSDVLGISGYQTCGCNDYILAEVPGTAAVGRCYVVMNPQSIVLVRPRDRKDHVAWLVERQRYEEALNQIEQMPGEGLNAAEIGKKYIEHLIGEGEYEKAAQLCPKVLGQDAKAWEGWVFLFAQSNHLQSIIPQIPTKAPRLSRTVYEMVIAHFINHDLHALQRTLEEWPNNIYDMGAVIIAIQSKLEGIPGSSADSRQLMECLAQMYLANHQPGKALPYAIRLRWPNVFDLIRDHNLFTDVQDQALLLVEFDQELAKSRTEGITAEKIISSSESSPAITLLVDHTYSIPVHRVVQQLQARPYFLYIYLDALSTKDPLLISDFSDHLVKLYAEFAPRRLLDFLRASNYYSLEVAFQVCKDRDFVPEMVFLLGKMGNNKQALTLIIERLGDVGRAIDFAKEQNDDDLWEDLLRYSETRPAFIRGLLENVGAEIDPIRLIRRIKNGLEIPGLKEALIKILQTFNLQISLLEGCQSILEGDSAIFAKKLQKDQTKGFFETVTSECLVCNLPLQPKSSPLSSSHITVHFLCRHIVHLHCVKDGDRIAARHKEAGDVFNQGRTLSTLLEGKQDISGKVALAATIRGRIGSGCPVCHIRSEGQRTQ